MQIRRIVDLSHPLTTGMPVYPGDPEVAITPATTIAKDGFNVLHVQMGSQSGTHVDAPFHFIDDGARIDRVALDRFVGHAVLADVRGLGPHGVIGTEMIPARPEGVTLLLLHTGWSTHWGSEHYFAHPSLSAEAAQRIVEEGYRLVAIDALSVDSTARGDHDFPAHMIILGEGIPICENLTGLDQIDWPNPVVSVLPLRLADADGAPLRAIAMELHGG